MTEKDPRKLKASIAGPGGPHERDSVVLDATNAILMDHLDVTVVGDSKRPDPFLAMVIAGRINHSQDRAEVMAVFDEDGAAAIISELMALAGRTGPEFRDRLMERVDKLIAEGNFGPQ